MCVPLWHPGSPAPGVASPSKRLGDKVSRFRKGREAATTDELQRGGSGSASLCCRQSCGGRAEHEGHHPPPPPQPAMLWSCLHTSQVWKRARPPTARNPPPVGPPHSPRRQSASRRQCAPSREGRSCPPSVGAAARHCSGPPGPRPACPWAVSPSLQGEEGQSSEPWPAGCCLRAGWHPLPRAQTGAGGCSEVGTGEVRLGNLGSFSENIPLPLKQFQWRQHLLGSPWKMMAGTNLANRWMCVYIPMYYTLGHELTVKYLPS